VRSVRSDWQRLPAAIEKAVVDMAFELRRPMADDDLFLLAIARLADDAPSRQVLAAEGVTAEVLVASIRTGGDGGPAPGRGFSYAPAYYSMHARAVAFAATLGDGTVTAEHVLLSLVWDAGSRSSQSRKKKRK